MARGAAGPYNRLVRMLETAPWQERSKEDCKINVNWFLSFCRKRELAVDKAGAEAFLAWLGGERGRAE